MPLLPRARAAHDGVRLKRLGWAVQIQIVISEPLYWTGQEVDLQYTEVGVNVQSRVV